MQIPQVIHWKPTLIICPYGCGYVFDKGLQGVYFDPTTGRNEARPLTEPGITVCSRCKRALSFDGALLHKLDEASLSSEDRLQLLRAAAVVVLSEVCSGKRY